MFPPEIERSMNAFISNKLKSELDDNENEKKIIKRCKGKLDEAISLLSDKKMNFLLKKINPLSQLNF